MSTFKFGDLHRRFYDAYRHASALTSKHAQDTSNNLWLEIKAQYKNDWSGFSKHVESLISEYNEVVMKRKATNILNFFQKDGKTSENIEENITMADEAVVVNSVDLAKFKVADLKKELKNRGLLITGNKNELLERLQLALHGEGSLVMESDSVVVDAEEMLDEDDVLADDSEEVLDAEILKTPTTTESPQLPLKRNSVEDITKDDKQRAKKIVLNRTIVPTVGKENQEAVEKPEKKIIKLSQLSTKERLEMRAQKFGGMANLSEDAKKAARAERFGIVSTSTTGVVKKANPVAADTMVKRAARFAISAPSSSVKGPSVDILKKRAERFGQSVSSALEKVDQEERLRKRKERFGLVEPKKVKTPLG